MLRLCGPFQRPSTDPAFRRGDTLVRAAPRNMLGLHQPPAGSPRMATAESLEGSLGSLWFHYDLRNDVLYVRVLSRRDDEVSGEENDGGLIILRSLADDSVVGMTAVNWWN